MRVLHSNSKNPTQFRVLTPLKGMACENIVGKGENTGNEQFILFSHNVSNLLELKYLS